MTPNGLSGENCEKVIGLQANQKTFLFSNGYSLLSNSHFTPFTVEKTKYVSMEQYLAAQKALMFKDYGAYEGIMRERSARKVRDYYIVGYIHDQWMKAFPGMQQEGLESKYRLHAPSRDKLMSTGTGSIVYATEYDRVNGSGLKLDDPRNEDPDEWRGWNVLGKQLVVLREKLREHRTTV